VILDPIRRGMQDLNNKLHTSFGAIAAGDMAEAQKMADNYNWLEAAKQKEETAREERQNRKRGN